MATDMLTHLIFMMVDSDEALDHCRFPNQLVNSIRFNFLRNTQVASKYDFHLENGEREAVIRIRKTLNEDRAWFEDQARLLTTQH